MSSYRVAVDHGVAMGSLTVLAPQPRSTGVQPTRRTYMGHGIFDEGRYVEMVWDGGIEDATAYQAILQDFGLDVASHREVTIYCRDEQFAWQRYNGTAIRPEPVWEQYFPRLIILVRDLVDVA